MSIFLAKKSSMQMQLNLYSGHKRRLAKKSPMQLQL